MARSTNKMLKDMHGMIGQFVVKQYPENKIVISQVPDMSRVKPSKSQQLQRKEFRLAVRYARSIVHDPEKKAAYAATMTKKGSVYHAAISEYRRKLKEERKK